MKINIDSYNIYPKVLFAGTRGSYGADAVLEFEFGESWEGLSKCVSFYPADASEPVAVFLGSDTELKIPAEVMSIAGQAKYIVSGVKDENTMISVMGVLQVAETLDAAEKVPGEVTPDLASQVLLKVTDAEEAAQNAAKSAEHCASLIEEYVVDTENAHMSAEAAKQNADSASKSAETAEQCVNEMLGIKKDVEEIEDSIVTEESERAAAEKERAENEEKRADAERARSENYRLLSNAIIGNKNGSFVKLEDVSPVAHELKVDVGSDDLMPYPYESAFSVQNSMSFSYDGKSVYADGTPSDYTSFIFGDLALVAGRYTVGGFSVFSDNKNFGDVRLKIRNVDDGNDIISEKLTNIKDCSISFEVTNTVSNARISVDFMPIEIWSEDGKLQKCSYMGTMSPYLKKMPNENTKLFGYGKNVCDIVSFSASHQGRAAECTLINTYGTEISTTGPSDSLEVVQRVKDVEGEGYLTYKNGLFFAELRNAIPNGQRVGISFDMELTDIADKEEYPNMISVMPNEKNVDGSRISFLPIYAKQRVKTVLNWVHDGSFKNLICFYLNGNSAVFSDFQIEYGDEVTEFERVNVSEHVPDADGKVNGVTSRYPVVTLVCDEEGMSVSAEYNKDANKVISALEARIAEIEK